MRTIGDLWNGNIAPCEHCGAHDSEANRLLCLIEKNHEALIKELPAAGKEMLQGYLDYTE